MKRFYLAFVLALALLCGGHLCAEESIFWGLDFVPFRADGTSEKISFTIGENAQTYTATRTLENYALNKYETTYRLWYAVRVWAEAHGYTFENKGQEGSEGKRGKAPTEEGKNQPVTGINWHDAIVWCNALSERDRLTPCYTYRGEVLRDSGDTVKCDLANCAWNANGYRLPTEAEWEYAARKNPIGLQRGDLASGEGGKRNFYADDVAWTFENASETHIVGTAGKENFSVLEGDTSLPGTGNANGAGLFDMSGNVLEFCWDWLSDYAEVSLLSRYAGPDFGEGRVLRGGSWAEETPFYYAGDRYAYDPNEAYGFIGFRLCRSLN